MKKINYSVQHLNKAEWSQIILKQQTQQVLASILSSFNSSGYKHLKSEEPKDKDILTKSCHVIYLYGQVTNKMWLDLPLVLYVIPEPFHRPMTVKYVAIHYPLFKKERATE